MVAHDLRAYSKAITSVNFFRLSSLTWNTDFLQYFTKQKLPGLVMCAKAQRGPESLPFKSLLL